MVFKPGQSGNPNGNRGKKPFVDALHCLITNAYNGKIPEVATDGSMTIAHVMAHRLVSGAMRTDWKPGEALAYMQEICDRAYGKPKQAIIGGDEDDNPIQHAISITDQDIINRYIKDNK